MFTVVAEEEGPKKNRIVSALLYNEICDFIRSYDGLAIDCELELMKKYGDLESLTLRSIVQTELTHQRRKQHWRYDAKVKDYLKMFQERSGRSTHSCALLEIAREQKISPVAMCRSILKEKYQLESKSEIARLIRYPHLIEDYRLAANVMQCLCSDSQDGPLIDLRRRVIGEEYEFKLKSMAKEAGMHYYDENDLRRLGYDKTPDIKMILPFLYKGKIINWIESKANFGDIKTHQNYIQQQLSSYCNRFGAGIVIYWFGYHEETPTLPENSIGIIVLDEFPSTEDIHQLNLSEANGSFDLVISKAR